MKTQHKTRFFQAKTDNQNTHFFKKCRRNLMILRQYRHKKYVHQWLHQFLEHIQLSKNDGQDMKGSRTHHFPPAQFPKFPGRTAQLHSKCPVKPALVTKIRGKSAEQTQCGCSNNQNCVAVPANRTKFQYWNWNCDSKLIEITSEDDQSPRKKKPREFKESLQRELRCSAGTAGGQQQFYQTELGDCQGPGLNGCQTMQQSAQGDFFMDLQLREGTAAESQKKLLCWGSVIPGLPWLSPLNPQDGGSRN